MKMYFIKHEIMGGRGYFMIRKKVFFGLFSVFFERWNSFDSAIIRLDELNK